MVFYDRQRAWFGGTRSSWRCGPEPSVFDRRPSARAWAVTDLPGGRLTQLPPVRGSEGPARMAGRARNLHSRGGRRWRGPSSGGTAG